MGYARILSENRRPYRTTDGFIGLLPYTDRHWRMFFEVSGYPEHAGDERFTTVLGRSSNIDALYQLLAGIVAERTTAEWLELLEKADIPHSPIADLDGLLKDPHLSAIGFFQDNEHPTEGPIRSIGIPVTFSRTPGAIRSLAPTLGEHTEEVISALRASAVTRFA
jgi:crotonobetainyl-CoA:carnitine CoA-transferase CaiB-like acyl-CoA transferase